MTNVATNQMTNAIINTLQSFGFDVYYDECGIGVEINAYSKNRLVYTATVVEYACSDRQEVYFENNVICKHYINKSINQVCSYIKRIVNI